MKNDKPLSHNEKETLIAQYAKVLGVEVQPLLDLEHAKEERDKGMAEVEAGASEDFKTVALDAVHRVALRMELFSVDDVWVSRGAWPEANRKALGPVMRLAQKNGWIAPTDQFRATAQATRHATPIRLWRSLVKR